MPIHPYEDERHFLQEERRNQLRRELGTSSRRHRRSFKDSLPSVIAILIVVGLVIAGVTWLNTKMGEAEAAGAATMAESTQVWKTTTTTRLASMSAATSTETSGHGEAFLGTGTFVVRTSEDQRLRYVEKRSDGGYAMDSISAENAVIYEIDDRSKPRIEIQTCTLTADTAEHQAWLDEHKSQCDDRGSTFLPKLEQTRIHVYVPKGTVVDTFDLNPEN